jgi:hypothetical protein
MISDGYLDCFRVRKVNGSPFFLLEFGTVELDAKAEGGPHLRREHPTFAADYVEHHEISELAFNERNVNGSWQSFVDALDVSPKRDQLWVG